MLNLFDDSDEAEIEKILAHHAAISAASNGTGSHEKQFRDVLQALPAAIYTTDADGRITFFNEACVDFAGHAPKIGDMWCVSWKLFRPDGTPLPQEDSPMAIALRENRPVRNMEAIAERPDGSRICFMPYPTPLRDPAGRLIGAVNMLIDITMRKQAEERMMRLAWEVDHRANNLLAVIQAILRLTTADTAEEFQAAFQGRLGALANVQRLFSVSRWTGANIRAIIEQELKPYAERDSKQVAISGRDLRLTAALAQAVAVSVHELATNAAKYGSLSSPSGRIEVSWRTDNARLALHWKETGGPRVAEPARTGFGVGAVDGVVRTLSGTITRQWKPEGLICDFCFPDIAA
ncbi:HWE histidine kinase domain-containing protein [Bradyrhizobium cenepequi]|uniref:HWE histidine kinase domain-containing protein n=1 Tax=Bradyrhizobium cenepequi TaxID=2821403 RepID=UPI001CE251D1|nr:HWE histidine kinase domain-containing protein [Bradyrhizobium cenepequi]MCA6109483.1 PAS domain S-box protein [Bradyrhizobium cenepequi]